MNIKYRLESILETDFRINYDYDYKDVSPDRLHIQIGHEIKPIIEDNKLEIKINATISDGDEDIQLASNTILLCFGLSPISEIVRMKEDGNFSTRIPAIFDTLLGVAVSTLRGVLMKNFKGTPLERCYLPLIPLEKISPRGK